MLSFQVNRLSSLSQIDLMHNDVTRLDAREECWSQQSSSGKIKQFKMATIQIFPGDDQHSSRASSLVTSLCIRSINFEMSFWISSLLNESSRFSGPAPLHIGSIINRHSGSRVRLEATAGNRAYAPYEHPSNCINYTLIELDSTISSKLFSLRDPARTIVQRYIPNFSLPAPQPLKPPGMQATHNNESDLIQLFSRMSC